MIHICDVAIIDVIGVQQFPVISPSENNWKLLHGCDMLSCNIANYLMKPQSEKIYNNGSYLMLFGRR